MYLLQVGDGREGFLCKRALLGENFKDVKVREENKQKGSQIKI